MLSGDSKWGAFYNCEAYLLPSHQENFGIAIIEAMACKKPVLITKNINIWREIEQGNGGWILNESNTAEIKNQLLELANLSPEAIELKGQNAFETFENKFLIDNCYANFINGLNSLI
jgi:glycosyltransferase involved in cell wall biosynthesis